MVGGKPRKQYYWQLRQFKHCTLDAFKETQCPQRQCIYFFKRSLPGVIVRVFEPLEKMHSWTFRELQVLQRLNDNPRIFHWKHLFLPIDGELVMAELDAFNRFLKEQLEEALAKRTKSLQRWLNLPLDDVFLVNLKTTQQIGCESAVFQIKTLCRTRYKNYFEMRSWKGPSWQGLLETADKEKLGSNSSFGCLLEEANGVVAASDISQYEDLLKMDGKRKMSAPSKEKYGEKVVFKQSLSFK